MMWSYTLSLNEYFFSGNPVNGSETSQLSWTGWKGRNQLGKIVSTLVTLDSALPRSLVKTGLVVNLFVTDPQMECFHAALAFNSNGFRLFDVLSQIFGHVLWRQCMLELVLIGSQCLFYFRRFLPISDDYFQTFEWISTCVECRLLLTMICARKYFLKHK